MADQKQSTHLREVIEGTDDYEDEGLSPECDVAPLPQRLQPPVMKRTNHDRAWFNARHASDIRSGYVDGDETGAPSPIITSEKRYKRPRKQKR